MLISSCLVHSIDAICLTNAPVNPGPILSNHITTFNGIYPYAYPVCSTSIAQPAQTHLEWYQMPVFNQEKHPEVLSHEDVLPVLDAELHLLYSNNLHSTDKGVHLMLWFLDWFECNVINFYHIYTLR